MNVFPEQRGTISLFAYEGQREGAIVAVILEELKLPYRLHLVKKPEDIDAKSLPVLRNIQSDGESVDLSGLHDIGSYLITRYDTAHEVSYKKGSKEDEEVNRLVASLTEPNAAHPKEHRFDLDAKDGIPFARKAISLYLLLGQRLQDSRSDFLVGKKCTLADLLHLPYVAAAESLHLDLEKFPELTRWYDRVYQRPAVQKGFDAVHLKIRG
ncbi:glutathione S-transferase [Aspergillus sergii]|uniref:Glutathione S-transferase n=1 Tax=Aspergillus sergii TaxID=1034303 RepID=A0A5N6X8K4_9EURO|nr:glutathione S-transferase [Aspergillus sergii]